MIQELETCYPGKELTPVFDFAGGQLLGTRENQQDFYAFVPPDQFEDKAILCVLADGMGGYKGGEIASEQAVRAFIGKFIEQEEPMSEDLELSLEAANESVGKAREESKDCGDMGTTLCAVYVREKYLSFISVGDSLIFLNRQGSIRRLNRIHTVGQDLQDKWERGLITREEYDAEPMKNCLTAALVGNPLEAGSSSSTCELEDGDIILMASDGILALGEGGLEQVYREGGTEWTASHDVGRILTTVRNLGRKSQDNTTIAIIKVNFRGGRNHSIQNTTIIKRARQQGR